MAYKKGIPYLQLKDSRGNNRGYLMAVFVIKSRHSDGTPKDCRLMAYDEKHKLSEDREKPSEFMTAWVPEEMVGNGGQG